MNYKMKGAFLFLKPRLNVLLQLMSRDLGKHSLSWGLRDGEFTNITGKTDGNSSHTNSAVQHSTWSSFKRNDETFPHTSAFHSSDEACAKWAFKVITLTKKIRLSRNAVCWLCTVYPINVALAPPTTGEDGVTQQPQCECSVKASTLRDNLNFKQPQYSNTCSS